MNLDDFSTTVDEQRYINPQVALDESNAFIQNLRDTQRARTADIAQDTYNLGTSVPSNLGGLGGAGTYFTSRYQTPQTSEVIANLRATAQAQALNDAMNNLVAQAQQRYNKAYKAYQKRHGGGNPTSNPQDPTGDTDYQPNNPETKDKPDIKDYITDTGFSNMGNMFGYSRQYPKLVDTPTYSTSYEVYTQNIKDPAEKARKWVDYLESIGYGG